jgi:hypothetical protein
MSLASAPKTTLSQAKLNPAKAVASTPLLVKVEPSVALSEHVQQLLLTADCADKTTFARLEQQVLAYGPASAKALLLVLEQGSLAQQALAAQLLIHFGAAVRGLLTRFCKAQQSNEELGWILSFLSHQLAL